LSRNTVCSGRNSPLSVTRFLSSSAPSARFSSARRACQLPSATKAAQAASVAAIAQPRGRKEYPEAMRYVVIGVLILILASLGSAAVYMLRGRGDSSRMAKALAWRVGLSVALFLFLMAGYYFGLFRPGQL
jgi:hypothetical protein